MSSFVNLTFEEPDLGFTLRPFETASIPLSPNSNPILRSQQNQTNNVDTIGVGAIVESITALATSSSLDTSSSSGSTRVLPYPEGLQTGLQLIAIEDTLVEYASFAKIVETLQQARRPLHLRFRDRAKKTFRDRFQFPCTKEEYEMEKHYNRAHQDAQQCNDIRWQQFLVELGNFQVEYDLVGIPRRRAVSDTLRAISTHMDTPTLRQIGLLSLTRHTDGIVRFLATDAGGQMSHVFLPSSSSYSFAIADKHKKSREKLEQSEFSARKVSAFAILAQNSTRPDSRSLRTVKSALPPDILGSMSIGKNGTADVVQNSERNETHCLVENKFVDEEDATTRPDDSHKHTQASNTEAADSLFLHNQKDNTLYMTDQTSLDNTPFDHKDDNHNSLERRRYSFSSKSYCGSFPMMPSHSATFTSSTKPHTRRFEPGKIQSLPDQSVSRHAHALLANDRASMDSSMPTKHRPTTIGEQTNTTQRNSKEITTTKTMKRNSVNDSVETCRKITTTTGQETTTCRQIQGDGHVMTTEGDSLFSMTSMYPDGESLDTFSDMNSRFTLAYKRIWRSDSIGSAPLEELSEQLHIQQKSCDSGTTQPHLQTATHFSTIKHVSTVHRHVKSSSDIHTTEHTNGTSGTKQSFKKTLQRVFRRPSTMALHSLTAGMNTSDLLTKSLSRASTRNENTHIKTYVASLPGRLVDLVHHGIPASYRAQIWYHISGAASKANLHPVHYYETLTVQGCTKAVYGDISKDIHRTFPGHPQFDSLAGQNALGRVLGAFAAHNPDVGYTQSVNFVAGFLLLLMPEEHAFWTLDTIANEYLPPEYYSGRLFGAQIDAYVMEDLISLFLPRLYAVMNKFNISARMICTEWLIALFTTVMPSATVMRIWDAFFCHGTIVLFRVALTLLRIRESYLLKNSKDFGALYMSLRQAPQKWFNIAQLLEITLPPIRQKKLHPLSIPWEEFNDTVLTELRAQAARRVVLDNEADTYAIGTRGTI